MASEPSALLKIEEQGDGENDGTWNQKYIGAFNRLEEAIASVAAINLGSLGGDGYILSDTQYSANESRAPILTLTGALTANEDVIVPARTKVYIVRNNTSEAYTVTVKTAAGSGIAVTQGKTAILHCDGTNVVKIIANDDFEASGAAAAAVATHAALYHGVEATTKVAFIQAAAPSGWTFDNALNDKVLRVTSTEANGGATGGSWTISGVVVDGHTLTTNETPAHTHTVPTGDASTICELGAKKGNTVNVCNATITSSVGGGSGHNHNLTIGSAWRPAYVDVIACTKD